MNNWSEIQSEFEDNFKDELVDRFQEYAFTEGHLKPLAEAKEKVEQLLSFFKSKFEESRLELVQEIEGMKIKEFKDCLVCNSCEAMMSCEQIEIDRATNRILEDVINLINKVK